MILKDQKFYDLLSADFDLMVSWEKRLKNESPFFLRLFEQNKVRKILDLACGTGHHAIYFARAGYEVTGVDISENMLEIARKNAKGIRGVRFLRAGFLNVFPRVKNKFDAVLCLGNSLPHLLSKKDLKKTLRDVFDLLNPGGIAIFQNRNYDRILKKQVRFMPPNIVETEDGKVVFFRLLDFLKDRVVFNLVTFRQTQGKWSFQTKSTYLRPILRKEIENLLIGQGFKELRSYGDYNFSPFEKYSSEDLIVCARK